jgi:phosphocarrier protein
VGRITRQVTIVNQLGLHARPASELVMVASRFKSEIFLARNGYEVNGKSIMGVMMLAAEKGTVLDLTAEGLDAEEALNALQQLVESGFGEE